MIPGEIYRVGTLALTLYKFVQNEQGMRRFERTVINSIVLILGEQLIRYNISSFNTNDSLSKVQTYLIVLVEGVVFCCHKDTFLNNRVTKIDT